MSKISLSPSPTGSAVYTIASPAGSTDRTLTLPDAAGTVFVGGQALSATTGNFSGNVTLGSSVLETPTGSAPAYLCRAWVNFNGTGTVAIRASGNVSSITDLGTGNYQVNFTTAMPDRNYAVTGTAMRGSDNAPNNNSGMDIIVKGDSTFGNSFSTTSVRVLSKLYNDNIDDALAVTVAIFR